MAEFLRHFAHQHPLFRKAKTPGGVEWRKSAYYFWWEFLRRHQGYRNTCEQNGKGKYAKLYFDFGDVHGTDFKTWWTSNDRGARLFAEPPLLRSVEEVAPDDLDQLRDHWDDSVLVIAIPLTLRKRLIEARLATILGKRHTRKQGQRLSKESQALYPIREQFNVSSLETALKVYDLKEQHPKMKLWEIAQELRFTTTLAANELGKRGQQSASAVEKKNVMSVAVSRKLRQAKKVIEHVGKGVFP